MEIEKVLTTRDSKMNFLKGLIRLAQCDDRLDEQELSFFQQAVIALGLDQSAVEEINRCWNSTDKSVITFESNEEKMFFFVQAVQLCWVDNEYQEIEQKEIQEMAKELCISQEAIKAVEEWTYEGVVWNKRGDELLKLS